MTAFELLLFYLGASALVLIGAVLGGVLVVFIIERRSR
jgi:hypothetical protein